MARKEERQNTTKSEVRNMLTLELNEASESEKVKFIKTLRKINQKRRKNGEEPIKYEMKELLIKKTIRSK